MAVSVALPAVEDWEAVTALATSCAKFCEKLDGAGKVERVREIHSETVPAGGVKEALSWASSAAHAEDEVAGASDDDDEDEELLELLEEDDDEEDDDEEDDEEENEMQGHTDRGGKAEVGEPLTTNTVLCK
jgi:U3 small nucleolar RNA-associated protein MPP10